MTLDLTGGVDGVPERFVPEQMKGDLAEAEHLCRYWWISDIVAGQRVLDAGCGVAFGTALMAEAGATEVVGVDIAGPVLEAVESTMPEAVTLTTADVRDLPFPADSFDVVVCYEVIEHVVERERVLDELRRVVTEGGVISVSSPNRTAYVPGNPHHVHEFEPAELREVLEGRFAHVALYRQHDFAGSVVLAESDLDRTGRDSLSAGSTGKTETLEREGETYILALASNRPLPTPRASACLSSPLEVRRWVEHFDSQQEILRAQAEALTELELTRRERQVLALRLTECEQALGGQIALEHELARTTADRDELRAQLDGTGAIVASMASSVSWRVTAPLRAAVGAWRQRR